MKAKGAIRGFLNSYTGQVLLGALAINLVLIPLLFASIFLLVGQDYKAQFINFARAQSFQLALEISENPEPERIQRLLDDMELSGQALYAEHEMDGGHIGSGMIGATVEFKEDFFFGEHGDDIYFVATKVADSAGQPRGTLKLGFDELPLVELIKTAYLRGAYIAAGYLVLTLILVGSFGYFLTRSIRRLRDAAHKIADGHTETELTIKTRFTEVSDLAQDLEVMRRELVRREQEIALREATQRNIVENVAEGIVTVDEQYLIRSFNRAAETMFGYAEREVLNTPFARMLSNTDAHLFNPAEDTRPLIRQELSGLRKSSQLFDLSLSTVKIHIGRTRLYTLLAQDISERKEFEAKLQRLATYDLLTKLPNRLFFNDRLTQTLSYAKRGSNITALFFIDLDHFKEINDTLGHEYGDLLLVAAAQRMSDCIRPEDTLARLGGDEFSLILSEIKRPMSAAVVAQKILSELSRPFRLNEREISISGSIGIAIFPTDAATAEALLSYADSAMYLAKKLGGNNYQYYKPE